MRKLLPVAALALLLPMAASAEANIGVKLGLSFPGGDVAQDVPMKDSISMAIPLELSVNFALAPQLDLGVYGGYAFVKQDADLVDSCDAAGGDCSEHLWRLGVKGEYKLAPPESGFVPYVGASLGMEWDVTNVKIDAAATDLTETLSGWEFGLEAGADMKSSETFSVGAFVGLAFGTYGKYKDEGTLLGYDVSGSGDITNTAMHEWFTIGVRGTFGLGGGAQ